MKSLKIIHKVTLLGLVVFCLTAVSLILTLRTSLSPALTSIMLEEQQADVRLLVAQIESALHQRQSALQLLADVLVEEGHLRSEAALNERLQSSILPYLHFNGGLAVFDQHGIGIAEAPLGTNRIGLDISDRDHLLQARDTRRPVITRPLISRSLGKPSFFINVPLLDDAQQILGYLIGVTVLERENFLLDLATDSIPDDVLFYVLDQANGLIVTASDPALAMEPLSAIAATGLLDALGAGMSAGRVYDTQKASYIYASAELAVMGWTVVRAIPADRVLQPVHELLLSQILKSSLVALLASLLLFVLLRRLLSPLTQATAQVKAVSRGEESYTRLQQGGSDEVGVLMSAFCQLHQSLDEQRQRLYLATSGTGVGIWEYRPDTHELFWDGRMCALYGIQPDDFDGSLRSWERSVVAEDLALVSEQMRQALEGQAGLDAEFRIRLPRGDERWIKANAVVVCDAVSGQTRMIGTNWDITERKRMELMKNQFISTVSHELRTPLTSIRGVLGLACHGQLGELSAQAQPMMHSALKNTEHLVALVNDLLDIDKLASGEMHFQWQQIDLIPVLHEAVLNSQPFARQYQVTVQTQDLSGPCWVRVDTERLHQVLNNLLSNAIKFSPSGAGVCLRMRELAGRVEVLIDDQGPGIPEAFRGRIFQRFAQADGSDTRQRDGTGLGLAISREIVHCLGGEIGFRDREEGGTTFFFTLPSHSAKP